MNIRIGRERSNVKKHLYNSDYVKLREFDERIRQEKMKKNEENFRGEQLKKPEGSRAYGYNRSDYSHMKEHEMPHWLKG